MNRTQQIESVIEKFRVWSISRLSNIAKFTCFELKSKGEKKRKVSLSLSSITLPSFPSPFETRYLVSLILSRSGTLASDDDTWTRLGFKRWRRSKFHQLKETEALSKKDKCALIHIQNLIWQSQPSYQCSPISPPRAFTPRGLFLSDAEFDSLSPTSFKPHFTFAKDSLFKAEMFMAAATLRPVYALEKKKKIRQHFCFSSFLLMVFFTPS